MPLFSKTVLRNTSNEVFPDGKSLVQDEETFSLSRTLPDPVLPNATHNFGFRSLAELTGPTNINNHVEFPEDAQ